MNQALKASAVPIYLYALVSLFTPLPYGGPVQVVVAILLAVHAVEVFVCMQHLRLYPGPLAVSIALTMLFGFLHWKPLADAAREQIS